VCLLPKIALNVVLATTIVCAILLRDHVTRAQTAPPVPSASVLGMGIDFQSIGPTDAGTATLPNGIAAITRSAALDAAGKHAMASVDPRTIAGVYYIARYGIFSDSQLHSINGTSPEQLQFVHRPAWLVSYYGPSVNISLPAGRATMTQRPVAHEVTVVVDAASGQFLESYIG